MRRSWNLTGKSDGLTADPATGLVIATLNEDGNSSLATINPEARLGRQVVLYSYAPGNPLPHGGGTDAVSIYHGKIFISASAHRHRELPRHRHHRRLRFTKPTLIAPQQPRAPSR